MASRNTRADSQLSVPETAGSSDRQLVQGPAGAIEVRIQTPPEGVPRRGAAVICHPHPLYGGTMDNKLVWALASAAARSGLVALRFNFRGVGASEGIHDSGRGERDDAVHLAGLLRAAVPGALVMAGFSFGGDIAIAACEPLEPDALVTVAPPLKYLDVAAPWRGPQCPWLLLHSRDDEIVPFTATMEGLKRFARQPQVVPFDGAGHFFHGRVAEVREQVEPFLAQVLGRG